MAQEQEGERSGCCNWAPLQIKAERINSRLGVLGHLELGAAMHRGVSGGGRLRGRLDGMGGASASCARRQRRTRTSTTRVRCRGDA